MIMQAILVFISIINIVLFQNLSQDVHRAVHIVYIQPSGETFTVEEQRLAYENVVNAAAFWQDLSPITTTLDIASNTQFVDMQHITTSFDVYSDPTRLLQIKEIWPHDLMVFVIDNSESYRFIYGQAQGIAYSAGIWIVTSSSTAAYAHEYGHALYDLPHQFQSSLDIMGLDPIPAWQQHMIGCATLEYMGKPCYKVILPIIFN